MRIGRPSRQAEWHVSYFHEVERVEIWREKSHGNQPCECYQNHTISSSDQSRFHRECYCAKTIESHEHKTYGRYRRCDIRNKVNELAQDKTRCSTNSPFSWTWCDIQQLKRQNQDRNNQVRQRHVDDEIVDCGSHIFILVDHKYHQNVTDEWYTKKNRISYRFCNHRSLWGRSTRAETHSR